MRSCGLRRWVHLFNLYFVLHQQGTCMHVWICEGVKGLNQSMIVIQQLFIDNLRFHKYSAVGAEAIAAAPYSIPANITCSISVQSVKCFKAYLTQCIRVNSPHEFLIIPWIWYPFDARLIYLSFCITQRVCLQCLSMCIRAPLSLVGYSKTSGGLCQLHSFQSDRGCYRSEMEVLSRRCVLGFTVTSTHSCSHSSRPVKTLPVR